ncbi:glycosyltransferase family 2 protein [Flavobacterium frigoris]|uniref:dTDP-Rha:A-D-GlcNAc-diphosphoryl polyprenol, A-3-L-rhamnosyl transferase WbbL n=1 Tax=Flavobacterium frigoris (strain PS1) TaxID=1086011 RepID=H7FRQ1_FLAFP|nr:glycosyltransferase family 2 protein [Flavobacterium frigoris]EIA08191.1 dTDP-Rha:A-D-GlcNAc-diphosphoryl polyprenol, A-3-L-rhamnosyl transferase WbbL [Flavobacterium frigoris PS1]
MQLSIVILNYNVRFFLELCVLSVQSALKDIDGEIIVVDNNSSDGSCAVMQERFPDIELIQNNDNLGFPKGNNIGVAQAKGKYICILNPDTVVAEDTFTKVLAFAERQINLGIVGVKLIDGAGNFLPESKRGVPTPFVAFTKMMGLHKIRPNFEFFGRYYAQHIKENQTAKVDILVGAFMFMEKELYQELEGFDENCFMYSDDIDLSYRALQKGKSNYYFHETTVMHYKGESTIRDGVYMKRFQEAMNFFYKKHFKVSTFFSIGMKIGIVFFSFIKMFQGKTKSKKVPQSFVFYSTNIELAEKMTSVLQKKVWFHDLNTEKMVISSRVKDKDSTEIILDNYFVSFKECIHFMESFKNKGVTFKIIPKNTNFLIGSDNSNERGVVVKIE